MFRLLQEGHRACYVKLSGATVINKALAFFFSQNLDTRHPLPRWLIILGGAGHGFFTYFFFPRQRGTCFSKFSSALSNKALAFFFLVNKALAFFFFRSAPLPFFSQIYKMINGSSLRALLCLAPQNNFGAFCCGFSFTLCFSSLDLLTRQVPEGSPPQE